MRPTNQSVLKSGSGWSASNAEPPGGEAYPLVELLPFPGPVNGSASSVGKKLELLPLLELLLPPVLLFPRPRLAVSTPVYPLDGTYPPAMAELVYRDGWALFPPRRSVSRS
jgi:hypothetical protein